MLSPDRRITSASDFKRVYSEGKGVRGKFLTLRFASGKGERTRFGLAPARKIKSAVMRNRAKRRLRELLRACLDDVKDSYDVVINIREEAVDASFEDLRRDLLSIMKRAGLMK